MVGYTCGCFDLLHEGHILFLRECKKYCDFLIVGLATDERVKEQGKLLVKRPIIPYSERLLLLNALKDVSLVIPDTSGPLSIIKTLQPTYYFKGLDWEGKLPEEELLLCRETNTEIKFIGSNSLTSTSKIITKIRELSEE